MLYRCTETHIFNLNDDDELEEYRNFKNNLDDSHIRYDEVIDTNYAVITINRPNWQKI